MRLLGILVLAAGIAVMMFAMGMDTSVAVADGGSNQGRYKKRGIEVTEEIDDAALLKRWKMWLWVGGFFSVTGLALAVTSGRIPGLATEEEDDEETAEEVDDEWVVEGELHKKKRRSHIEEEEDEDDANDMIERERDRGVHTVAETLRKLNELRKEGVLTDEEFNAQKAKLLR